MAERSGDTAFGWHERNKAVWRFASHRTPYGETRLLTIGHPLLSELGHALIFYELDARPRLIAGAFTPGVGLADALEMASVPQLGSIVAGIREVAHERA